MSEINNLVRIAKWAGQRFDLVQAGGGNVSVKLDNKRMLIKASGVSLSELTSQYGYAEVVMTPLLKVLKDEAISLQLEKHERMQAATELVAKATKDAARASIETLLHLLLDTYVLHSHGIVVNIIAARKNWQETFTTVFPESICVPYQTPGIELAYALQQEIEKYQQTHGKKPSIIFLQNHGLIISAPTAEEVIFITEEVTLKLEQVLNITENIYRANNTVSDLVNAACKTQKIAYLSNDDGLKRLLAGAKPLFFQKPFCPDIAVYCGQSLVILDSLQDQALLERYWQQFGEAPRVIIFQDKLFLIADSVKKARDIEEMLKFHLSVLVLNLRHNIDLNELNYLADEEITFLANWEAEKFRQNVN